MKGQGYAPEHVAIRRRWVEERTGVLLKHAGACSLDTEKLRGNVENAIGAAQVPLGIAGPLLVRGQYADGAFYVPMATTEGALVRSYERGMVALTRAGGVTVRVLRDENSISPVFSFDGVAAAHEFARTVSAHLEDIRREAESTTRHGRLLGIEVSPTGRQVVLTLRFHTGDAHGMNMIARAGERACEWIVRNTNARSYLLFSGYESEKHASARTLAGRKGKTVIAEAVVPARILGAYLHAGARQMEELWRRTVIGHLQAHAVGYNGHFANGLTAIFIACGQDVANVANAAVGVTSFERTGEDLYASVTLTSLTVATVGGGTGLGTASECLGVLGCAGAGKAPRLAEIVAGALLAGELSMGAAIASGEFVSAHERYGRNRPGTGVSDD
jgi:hydroxymethylglutaryl-CoA reductase (NADPH)